MQAAAHLITQPKLPVIKQVLENLGPSEPPVVVSLAFERAMRAIGPKVSDQIGKKAIKLVRGEKEEPAGPQHSSSVLARAAAVVGAIFAFHL